MVQVFWVLLTAIVLLSVVQCGVSQDLKTIKVDGISMAPTINEGDTLRIDRAFYRNRIADRFDIVAFALSEEQKRHVGRSGEVMYITRVVGLPGEEVEIKAGATFINGTLLKEDFLDFVWTENNFGPLRIPQGEYFVVGDNRANSLDSRYLKPSTVRIEHLKGKVVETARLKK